MVMDGFFLGNRQPHRDLPPLDSLTAVLNNDELVSGAFRLRKNKAKAENEIHFQKTIPASHGTHQLLLPVLEW